MDVDRTLSDDFWDHIAEEAEDLPIPSWQMEELRLRRARFEANPDSGKSWAEIEKNLRARHGPK